MFEALPRRGMGVEGRPPRADRGPVLAKEDSSSCGPDAISSSTYAPTQTLSESVFARMKHTSRLMPQSTFLV